MQTCYVNYVTLKVKVIALKRNHLLSV